MRHLVVLLFICSSLYPYSSQFKGLNLHSKNQRCPDFNLGSTDFFECNDGQCILSIDKCDGILDCVDGSDEKDCDNNSYSFKCDKHEYTCKNDDCIPAMKFCDIEVDCPDGSDEYDGCVHHLDCGDRFQCNDRHCVLKEWVCDGNKDCSDGSDEWNCSANKTSSASNCKTENSQYLCENKRCISLNAVCDKKDDCGDGSDEGLGCSPSNCPSSIKCDHECKKTPKGSICFCKPGYKLQNDNRTCIDIDECQIYGICDQECLNSPGSYRCKCQTDYSLQEDKKTCKARAGEATIMFSTRTEIVGMYLDSKIHFEHVKNLNRAVAVAVNGDHVYWSDIENDIEIIARSTYQNKHEVIITTGLSEITAIAIDWITSNIYFTDKGHHRIGVCDNNGTYCTVIIIDTDKPAGIALLPSRGKMYWCDWGSNPHIAVAGMDGKNIRTFVSENIEWPKSLTIDYPNDRLYWVDSKSKIIESIRLDGTDRRLVLHDIIREPFSLAIFENRLYWSDWESNTIESCNKFTGKDWHILFRVSRHQPYNIYIDHSAIKPKINNPCHSNPCSQLCMLNQNKGYTCACTLDKELNADNHTCREKKNQHLLIFDGSTFINYYHEMVGKPKLIKVPTRSIKEIISDPISGKIILCDTKWSKLNIMRFDPVSGISENIMLLNTSVYFIEGIAFDHIGNNLYITNSQSKSIEVYSLKTLAMTVFYFKDYPYYITLVPEERKMYVALKKSSYLFNSTNERFSIYEMDMDGLGEKKLIKDKLGGPNISMYYDRGSKMLFISDQMIGYIWSHSTEGTRIFRTGLKLPGRLAVAGDNIFWTEFEFNSKVLYWTNFKSHSRSNHKDVAFHMTSYSEIPLVITLRKDAKQDHDCQKNNGNCSHVCLLSSTTSFICACPPREDLSNDNRTCIMHKCLKNDYKCSGYNICLPKEKVCDGIVHCPNGEDEMLCNKKSKCKEDQFSCTNGECISSKSRCNSHYDCTDQSDEANCEIPKCKSDQFQCRDGICISTIKVCNGYPDCLDFSDELSNNCKLRTCATNEFMCNDRKCIPKLFVCDGEVDCKDEEDEAECKLDVHDAPCLGEHFRCNNGHCISLSLKCDGTDDCPDGSDERHCLVKPIHSVNCTGDEYRCLDTNTCLSKEVRCNGRSDCPRNDDEHNCTYCLKDEFVCDNRCIPESWVCDSKKDCNDNSDESNCDGGRKITEFNECHEFKCSTGTCLSYSKVCDDTRDCPDGSDEDGKCQTACVVNNFCKGLCYKTPIGSICGCQDGYRLAADAISCEDINECDSEVCSQICQNTVGSFECSCNDGYIIRNDKISCKAIGPAMEFITVTDTDIRKISYNLHSVEVIHRLVGLGINGFDVDAIRESVYWSDEFGTIQKHNIETKETTIMIAGHPQALAVDWITDNVYVNDNDHLNTIKVCNLEKQRCATLVKIEDMAIVVSLIVDPINRWLFWAQITWQMDKPFSKIYRTDMMGADKTIIGFDVGFVTAMTVDRVKSKLYWSNSFNNVIESSNLDGSQRDTLLSTNVHHPLGISIYEQSLYWLMGTNGQLQSCKLYGKKSCETLNIGTNNVHRNFAILHISRQPVVKNPCDEENCDYMCILKKENATCVCSDGKPIKSNNTCTINNKQLSGNLKRNARHTSSVYSIIIIILLFGVLLLGVYYYYQRNRLKSKPIDDLSWSSIRFQNPSYDRSDEVEVTLNSIVTGLHPGQHEYVNPVDDKFLSIKAVMENNESRRRSDQYLEESTVKEAEKQDSLIYFVHSK